MDCTSTFNFTDDDSLRVNELRKYEILDTAPEQALDDIAKLAAQLFNVPIAMISFVDTEKVFVKAVVGIENPPSHGARKDSLCTIVIQQNEVAVFNMVPNDNPCNLMDPLYAGEHGLQFYAGAPLTTNTGFRIGTICLIDTEPRQFSREEANILKSLSFVVMDYIEFRRKKISTVYLEPTHLSLD